MKLPDTGEYKNPNSKYILPALSRRILKLLHKKQKPLILKREIIRKNKANHPEILLTEYNEILFTGLYKTREIIQPNFKNKPHYFNFVGKAGKNNVVVTELSEHKDNYEIVSFFKVKDKHLERMRQKTRRDGGQSIITGQQS